MNFEDKLNKYAKACVNVGINLKKGQPLYISCPIACNEFAHLLMKEAYLAGASDVYVRFIDEMLTKIRYDYAPDKAFESSPDWILNTRMEALDKKCAFISIVSDDPELLKDCDPKKIAANGKTLSTQMLPFAKRLMNNESQWLVISYPSVAAAKKVFPNENGEKAVELLWEQIFAATRIDENDVQENWDKHVSNLKFHVKRLNEFKFKELILTSANGTNVTVGLPEKHVWEGGGDVTLDGHPFLPNMPTEEVFTMPHKDQVNGIIKSSKPLHFRGNLIDNFTLTVKDGVVIDYDAEVGYEILKGLLETDNGAKSFGEIALVPFDSPISNSNLTFFNTLYDENASCHFAFGRAYPTNLEGGDKMNDEELKKNGANHSLIHEDFMFGTDSLDIVGVKADGSKVQIFKNGNWA